MGNQDSNHRPNADLLLKSIQKMDESSKKGQLRIFFGMCPGVGKTYAMLKAAHLQKAAGKKVLIGVVETHSRVETEKLVLELDRLPLKKIIYRDTELSEMDLDQILLEQPDIVLVDELAHTNIPGSRHPKRYQDVFEILDAGIDVYTTLNVQHVTSRADIVSQITGIQIRETVPDSIFEYAHQLELIDLTPEELLQRLKDGKVYLGERAERAKENFFKPEHISALRELTLRFAAEVVDYELLTQRTLNQVQTPWKTVERFLVAISHSPFSDQLIRTTRRMAFRINAPWIALYVETGNKLTPSSIEMLQKNIKTARELGAEVITTRDDDIPTAIKRTAVERNVTQIVVGRPIKRFFSDRIRGGTLLDQLVQEISDIDIHVIRQDHQNKRKLQWSVPQLQTEFSGYWNTAWFLLAVTALNVGLEQFLGYRAIGFIYLLATIVISLKSSRGPIIFSGLFSTLIWNFFFIPPKFTFTISSAEDFMMCLMFFVVSITMGTSADRLRRKDKILLQREKRAQTLYLLSQNFSKANNSEDIVKAAIDSISEVFEGKSLVFFGDGTHLLRHTINPQEIRYEEKDFSQAVWSYRNREKAGFGTNTLNSAQSLSIPLIGHHSAVGVLLFYPKRKEQESSSPLFSLEQENLLDTICNHLGIAFEHTLFEQEMSKARIFEESNKLYKTLLDSVSHELRTPLTSIIGNSSALKLAAESQQIQVIAGIADELTSSSRRLNRVIENLLDMSRLTSGTFRIKQEIISIEEVIQESLRMCAPETLHHVIETRFPENSLYIRGDDRLLEHVFSNLILNAAQYSPEKTKIRVTVSGDTSIKITVEDEGPGIPEIAMNHLFDQFYRIPGSAPGGTGLGLSIVKQIVESHRGSVTVQNRSEKGSCFQVTLPRTIIPEDFK